MTIPGESMSKGRTNGTWALRTLTMKELFTLPLLLMCSLFLYDKEEADANLIEPLWRTAILILQQNYNVSSFLESWDSRRVSSELTCASHSRQFSNAQTVVFPKQLQSCIIHLTSFLHLELLPYRREQCCVIRYIISKSWECHRILVLFRREKWTLHPKVYIRTPDVRRTVSQYFNEDCRQILLAEPQTGWENGVKKTDYSLILFQYLTFETSLPVATCSNVFLFQHQDKCIFPASNTWPMHCNEHVPTST